MIWPALGVTVGLSVLPVHAHAATPVTATPAVHARVNVTNTHAVSWPWAAIAQCESGGNWHINTGNGFYGGLQFSLASWRGVGGAGLPSEASKREQVKRAILLQRLQGWGAWPVCSVEVGL